MISHASGRAARSKLTYVSAATWLAVASPSAAEDASHGEQLARRPVLRRNSPNSEDGRIALHGIWPNRLIPIPPNKRSRWRMTFRSKGKLRSSRVRSPL